MHTARTPMQSLSLPIAPCRAVLFCNVAFIPCSIQTFVLFLGPMLLRSNAVTTATAAHWARVCNDPHKPCRSPAPVAVPLRVALLRTISGTKTRGGCGGCGGCRRSCDCLIGLRLRHRRRRHCRACRRRCSSGACAGPCLRCGSRRGGRRHEQQRLRPLHGRLRPLHGRLRRWRQHQDGGNQHPTRARGTIATTRQPSRACSRSRTRARSRSRTLTLRLQLLQQPLQLLLQCRQGLRRYSRHTPWVHHLHHHLQHHRRRGRRCSRGRRRSGSARVEAAPLCGALGVLIAPGSGRGSVGRRRRAGGGSGRGCRSAAPCLPNLITTNVVDVRKPNSIPGLP